jgi:cytochrome c oxidase cbb3-type subunit III
MATATLRSGEKYTGRVRNEDNFSLQLQTLDGIFHFLTKSELEDLEYSSQPLMPTNFGSTLSPDELNDVVSYLMNRAGVTSSLPKKPEKEFEDE